MRARGGQVIEFTPHLVRADLAANLFSSLAPCFCLGWPQPEAKEARAPVLLRVA